MSTAAVNPAAINPEQIAGEPSTPPAPMSAKDVLAIPVMRRLWYAQIVSTFGDFLALFAVISVMTFKLHATPEQVTGLQIAYLLPIAVLSVLAGVFVDRWPLKTTLVASDLTRAALCLLLLLATERWHFYAILAAISVLSSFFGPAQGVSLRSAVPMHGLRSANTLMQQVLFGMRIIGPAMATFLVAKLGASVCYWADSASFMASAVLIGTLALRRPQEPASPDPVAEKPKSAFASIVPDMQVGMGFILGHRALQFVMAAFAAAMFVVGCFGPLIAVYVRDCLHAETLTFGYAQALVGVGMMAGATTINSRLKHVSNQKLVLGGLTGMGVALCLLTGVALIWTTFLANFVLGMAVAAIIVPATTLMQLETPAALVGRVGSTFMSIVFAAQISGLVLSGQIADRVGVRHVFAYCAGLLAVLIVGGLFFISSGKARPQAGEALL